MIRLVPPLALAALLLVAPAANAKQDPLAANPPPAAVKALLDCRTLSDSTRRLACFDETAAAFAAAAERRDLVVVDRGQIRSAGKSLFGLTLPRLAIFGGGDKDDNEVTEINSTMQRVRLDGYQHWHFTLEDGARWTQTETKTFARDPKAGMKVRIRKAAVGSFLANFDGQTATRVVREN